MSKTNKPWYKPEFMLWNSTTGTWRIKKALWTRSRRQHWLKKYRASQGCSSCGIKDSRVLEFNHRDPSTKVFNVMSTKESHLSKVGRDIIKAIISEVRKCDVLCANCHKIHTDTEKTHNKSKVCYQDRESIFNDLYGDR